MLIDCSYFTKGSRHILNATASLGKIPNADALKADKAIEGYVAECQEQYLVDMLGGELGNKIHTYLVCMDEDEEPVRNENIDAICDRLREPFADYVFFYILRHTATQATSTGLVRLKCANEYVSPRYRQVSAWNSMVDKNRRFAEWCKSSDCHFTGICIKDRMLTKINQFNL